MAPPSSPSTRWTRRGPASDVRLKLAVTTCYAHGPAHLERARSIAQRFGAPLLERTAWAPLFAASGAEYIYVVAREHDEVRDASGNNCFVQEGLLSSKLTTGRAHPFIRAVLGADAEVATVLDGTLGLANDALHLATVLGCSVRGVEGSPMLHALLEEGVPRLAHTWPNATRISVEHGQALDVLRGMATGSVDVVTLDPMMSRARKSAPSFSLLREFALAGQATLELVEEAARVAHRRVVLKLGRGAPLPPGAAFARHERGARITYWVHELAPATRPG